MYLEPSFYLPFTSPHNAYIAYMIRGLAKFRVHYLGSSFHTNKGSNNSMRACVLSVFHPQKINKRMSAMEEEAASHSSPGSNLNTHGA